MRSHVLFLLKYSVDTENSVLLDNAKCKWLLDEISRLESCISTAHETIEYVAIGQKLECPQCGGFKPCLCDKS